MIPLVSAAVGVRTILMVVLQTTPPLLLAAPEGGLAVGVEVSAAHRPSAVTTARGWLENITRGRLQGTPECFLAGTLRTGGVEDQVVVCPLSSVPAGFPDTVVTNATSLPRQVRRQAMAWVALPALAPTPLYAHAALTVARLATFQRPSKLEEGAMTAKGWAVGARPWARVQAPGWVHGRWDANGKDRLASVDAADARLRARLGNLPQSDPDHEALTALLDSTRPLDSTELPAAVREGALPEFADPALARVPFSARVQPPVTEAMEPPAPQRPARGSLVRRLDQIIKPAGLDRLFEYLSRYFEWLKWLLHTPHSPGPPRPEVFTLGPEWFFEEAVGHLWGLNPDGTYSQVDLCKPIETHLDLSFLTHYREGYPDQELFGHLLYGVSLKAPTPFQIMLQPHMVSALGRFDAIQKELPKFQARGWYELVRQLPYIPFAGIQQGLADRLLEPDRPRRTSNYSAPHTYTEDGVGQEVVPVNVACVRADPDWAGAGGYAVGLSAPPLPLPSQDRAAERGVGVHLFSGRSGVSQGFAAEARARGWGVLEVDLLSHPAYDLLDMATYHSLLAAARSGRIRFLMAGIPCETFSIARWRRSLDSTARPLRDREDARPLAGLTWHERLAVARADTLAERTCHLCQAVHEAGGVFVIENPPDRGSGPYAGPFWPQDHAPLWRLPCILALQENTGAQLVSCAQCRFGAPTQKVTSFLLSSGVAPYFTWLDAYQCNHRARDGPAHMDMAVGWDEWWCSRSRRAAAYPPSLNASLARGFTEWHDGARSTAPSASWDPMDRAGPAGLANPAGVALPTGVADPTGVAGPASPAVPAGEADPASMADPTGLAGAAGGVPSAGRSFTGKHPPEVKPGVSDAMNDLSVLEYPARLVGKQVFQKTSDFANFFNQLALRQDEKYKCGWLTLALPGSGADVNDPVLAFVIEHVLGFGCTVSSQVCQRFGEYVMHIFRRRMAEIDESEPDPLLSDPRLAGWVQERRALSQLTGRNELRLWTCHIYTDDPWWSCVGEDTMLTINRVWEWVTSNARLLMAIPAKQQLGTCVKWLGVKLAAGLGVAYVAPDKRLRALNDIQQALAGSLPIDRYRSLCGLLVHLLFLADMRRSALYGLFTPFQAGGIAEHGPQTLLAGDALTPVMRAQLGSWAQRLEANASAPFYSAIPGWQRSTPMAQVGEVPFLRSDAAKEGASTPGICGNLYGRYWIHELTPDELKLPIGVTEFVGAAGNLSLFGTELVGYAEVVCEVDALASPQILSRSRARSALMQHAHLRLQQDRGYQAIEPILTVQHMYGDGNPITDAGSRGREPLLRSLLSNLGCAPRRVETPAFVRSILPELVELHRSLAPQEEARGKSERGNTDGDGPAGLPIRTQLTLRPLRRRTPMHRRRGAMPAVAGLACLTSALTTVVSTGRARPSAESGRGRSCRSNVDGDGAMRAAPYPIPVGDRLARATDPGRTLQYGSDEPRLGRQEAIGGRLPRTGAATVAVTLTHATPSVGDRIGRGVCAGPIAYPSGGHLATATGPGKPTRAGHLASTGGRLPSRRSESASPPHVQAFATSQLHAHADSLTSALQQDRSPWAIPASRLHLVDEIAVDIYELADEGAPVGTRRQQSSNWKHWCAWCAHLGVSPWRMDAHANSGYDPVGARREAFILAGGLRFIYNRMQPRRRADPVPQPQSALNVILGIRRLHRDKGTPMVAMPMVNAIVKGLMRRVQEEYGDTHPNLLVPDRKEPFTREILESIADIRDDTVTVGGRERLRWDTPVGRALWALLCTLCSTGFRKSEVSRTSPSETRPIASRASAVFRIGGVLTSSPTKAQLLRMGRGDCAIVTPPPSKADQFGTVWGANPIYLHWGLERLNACRALVAMEIGDPVDGPARRHTPMFSPDGQRAFTGQWLDTALKNMLNSFMPASRVQHYSWHSARIYLACALRDAGASPGEIQALCRWVSEQSLHIYARMNESAYVYWLTKAMRADVSSVRATTLQRDLPLLDDVEIVRGLLSLNLADRTD
jgi:hypothetical protein